MSTISRAISASNLMMINGDRAEDDPALSTELRTQNSVQRFT